MARCNYEQTTEEESNETNANIGNTTAIFAKSVVAASLAVGVSLASPFAALADPTRRAILNRLALGEANVSELAEPFPMSLPAISKHLRVLEDAGLMVRRKEGRTHHCQLRTDPLTEAAEWIEEARQFWGNRLDALAEYLEQPDSQAKSSKESKK